MAGQQRFWCPNSYNSEHLRKGMYGSKPNGYRTVGTFRTSFTFSELAGLDGCNHLFNSILLTWEAPFSRRTPYRGVRAPLPFTLCKFTEILQLPPDK